MNLKETYNKIAKDWYNEVSASHWWENGLAKFSSFLKKGDTVLDAGCGPGITAKYFIKNGFEVTGIDFSENMIGIAKQQVPEGNFLVMDIKDAGSLQETFDGIYLQNVLLHIQKKEAGTTLKSLAAKLKTGGYMYVSVKEKTPGGQDEHTRIDNDYGYEYKRFFSYFTVEEIKNVIKDSGLQIFCENIVPAGKTRWIQIIGILAASPLSNNF